MECQTGQSGTCEATCDDEDNTDSGDWIVTGRQDAKDGHSAHSFGNRLASPPASK